MNNIASSGSLSSFIIYIILSKVFEIIFSIDIKVFDFGHFWNVQKWKVPCSSRKNTSFLNCDHYGKGDFRVFSCLWRKSSPVTRLFARFCFHSYVKKWSKKEQWLTVVNSVIIIRVDNLTMTDTCQPAFIEGNKWKQIGNKKEQARHYAVKPVAEHTSLVRDSGNTTKHTIHRKIRPNYSHNPSNQHPTYEQKWWLWWTSFLNASVIT